MDWKHRALPLPRGYDHPSHERVYSPDHDDAPRRRLQPASDILGEFGRTNPRNPFEEHRSHTALQYRSLEVLVF